MNVSDRIKKVNAGHMDWVKLYQTIDSALPIIDQISFFSQQSVSSSSQSLDSVSSSSADKTYLDSLLVNLNIQVIKNLSSTLHHALDIPETREMKQVTIRPGYDQVWCIISKTICIADC